MMLHPNFINMIFPLIIEQEVYLSCYFWQSLFCLFSVLFLKFVSWCGKALKSIRKKPWKNCDELQLSWVEQISFWSTSEHLKQTNEIKNDHKNIQMKTFLRKHYFFYLFLLERKWGHLYLHISVELISVGLFMEKIKLSLFSSLSEWTVTRKMSKLISIVSISPNIITELV